jgi:uncharacterized protein (TIGR03382 family)
MFRTLATLSWLLPSLVLAQTLGGSLVGKHAVVNAGPGDQTDPHVSGALVAYTSEVDDSSQIRYHDLRTGLDAPVPSSGSFDFVSDISGGTVVFTRVTATSSIYTYDVNTEAPPTEIAPVDGANRRGAVIGGRTVAWQDFNYRRNLLESEVAAFDLDRRILTRLTDDAQVDRTPAVSADGQVIVWSKCQTNSTGCDIWQARATQGGFLTQQLTGAEGEDIQPDTNGQVVVYASTRTVDGVTDRDIHWRPVGGGEEQRLALAGIDTNPSISGSLLAFERYDASAPQPNYDIYLYDLNTLTLYALTQTPHNENLNDISVGADGTVRVVWTVPENGDFNVHAFSFELPKEAPDTCTTPEDSASAEDVCAAPGSRPVLASVEVSRTTGKPSAASLQFQGSGPGVLCVDNGFTGERSTSGWVTLNGATEVDPSSFKHAVSLVARRVELQGDNALGAIVAGQPGSAFRVRVYGPLEPDCGDVNVDEGAQVVPGLALAPVRTHATASFGASARLVPAGDVGSAVPEPVEPGGVQTPSEPVVEPGNVGTPAAPVPEAEELPEQERRGGCTTGGGSLMALGVLALASLLLRRR